MMTVERAEILHDELYGIKYEVLGCGNPEIYHQLSRLIQVVDEILMTMPKIEPIEENDI